MESLPSKVSGALILISPEACSHRIINVLTSLSRSTPLKRISAMTIRVSSLVSPRNVRPSCLRTTPVNSVLVSLSIEPSHIPLAPSAPIIHLVWTVSKTLFFARTAVTPSSDYSNERNSVPDSTVHENLSRWRRTTSRSC